MTIVNWVALITACPEVAELAGTRPGALTSFKSRVEGVIGGDFIEGVVQAQSKNVAVIKINFSCKCLHAFRVETFVFIFNTGERDV